MPTGGPIVYGRRYRERPDAVELDPVKLKVGQKPFLSPTHVKVSIRGLAQQYQAIGGSEIADQPLQSQNLCYGLLF